MNQQAHCSKEYLKNIHSPKDLKAIPREEMPALAEEIRQELIRITAQNGGHLASNLGVVELSMAIHRVFDTPHDHVIFDVGHQSYVHKMLTGRYGQMDTIRQAGGLSGFTNRFESEHDCFGAGHSSTSLSAALGFAISDRINHKDSYTVAVIGDGAYTGGMIHEALNNCRKDLNLIIVMNENEMSISPNIGEFAKYLSKLRTKAGYFKIKKATGSFLKKIPLVGKALFGAVLYLKKALKNLLYGSNYFESMGLTYLGPIDGNDYNEVENLLREAKKLGESVVVHVKTQKGKGYFPAEEAPDIYHGIQPKVFQKSEKMSFSETMGLYVSDLAQHDGRICAITAAMCDGTGLRCFKNKCPERFFDVGIAEEHALTFAAGLAANGMLPYVAVYSTFLQRGYDNLIHDIALQKLPVVICVDRAGLNAGDGATHHGIFDVPFLSQIPGMKIYAPITAERLQASLREAYQNQEMCAIRYPNGVEEDSVIAEFYSGSSDPKPGAVRNYREDDQPSFVIVTYGRIVTEAMAAEKILRDRGIHTGIILLEVLKPYEETMQRIVSLLPKNPAGLIFLEEGIQCGGMGMNLSELMQQCEGLQNTAHSVLAIQDSFVAKRLPGQNIYDAAKIGANQIVQCVERLAYEHRSLKDEICVE